MQNYDLVIPLKPSESIWGDNKELLYLLRSVEQNFPVNRVIIVSPSLPAWLNKDSVIYVEYDDPFFNHKDANIIRKILKAIDQVDDLSDTFFWSCDDHLVLRRPKTYELKPMFLSELKNEQAWWWSGPWKQGMKRTMEFLESNGRSTYHYDVHIPQPVEKKKFEKLMGNIELREHERYCINTLYFNQAIQGRHIHIGNLKGRFEEPVNSINEVRREAYGRLYMNYNNKGLTHHLQSYICELFPNPSKYENE